jgi:site-specific recombinase XerD
LTFNFDYSTLLWRLYGGFFNEEEGAILQAKITQSLVQNIAPQKKVFRVNDTLIKGFVLIVRPSGKKTWVVDYRKPDGTRTDYKIGTATLFTVLDAREEAKKFLLSIEKGEDPTAPPPDPTISLGDFLRDIYGPWVTERRKTGQETVIMISRAFKSLLNVPLDQITVAKVEQWRTQQIRERNVKASSLNRELTALKASINWAVSMDIIKENLMNKVKHLPERDSRKIIRYLTDEERSRLMDALDEREKEMRQGRHNHNEWLDERGLEKRSLHKHFTDHLKPIILLSLSTGIRKSTLFGLEWRDVNFTEKILTLREEIEKSDKTRHTFLNDTAYDVLLKWKEQSIKTGPNALIFPSPQTGKKMGSCKSAWEALLERAGIEGFRWHDMRHDFASQLVMEGVDLNTVRELMGHADLKMTLRYAHLAPENKLQAVKVLDKKHRPKEQNNTVLTELSGI